MATLEGLLYVPAESPPLSKLCPPLDPMEKDIKHIREELSSPSNPSPQCSWESTNSSWAAFGGYFRLQWVGVASMHGLHQSSQHKKVFKKVSETLKERGQMYLQRKVLLPIKSWTQYLPAKLSMAVSCRVESLQLIYASKQVHVWERWFCFPRESMQDKFLSFFPW